MILRILPVVFLEWMVVAFMGRSMVAIIRLSAANRYISEHLRIALICCRDVFSFMPAPTVTFQVSAGNW